MELEEIFDKCRGLALDYGYVRDERHADYFDSFGCDFQIIYRKSFSRTKGWSEIIKVCFGGKQVYNYDELLEKTWVDESQNWWDLLEDLSMYEFCRYQEEFWNVSFSKINFFKREAEFNRRFLMEYSNMGMVLAKELGELKCYDDGCIEYKFATGVGDYGLSVYYSKEPRYDSVGIYCDKTLAFLYYCNVRDGGEFGLNNQYTRGKWEKDIFRLYMSITEFEDRQG